MAQVFMRGVLVLPEAFVLIVSEVGQEDQVIIDLQAIPEVKVSYVVYGVYDVIARVEAESMQRLKDVVSLRIRQLDTVRTTLTMLVV
jgi:DNA-binding Lrp family transcriptional regulator